MKADRIWKQYAESIVLGAVGNKSAKVVQKQMVIRLAVNVLLLNVINRAAKTVILHIRID